MQTNNPKQINRIKKPTLRIIGGIFKGRNLQMAPLEVTRSSKAILKESLFNTLSNDVVGANFVEFFAGSGSIGIEALSRGAKRVVFFEQNRESYQALDNNVKKICKDCDCEIIFGDTFVNYKESLRELKGFSIGYFDPPFDVREGMEGIYQQCFKVIKSLDSRVFGIMVLEHISSLRIPQNLGDFECVKTRKFGKSALSYFVIKE